MKTTATTPNLERVKAAVARYGHCFARKPSGPLVPVDASRRKPLKIRNEEHFDFSNPHFTIRPL